MSENRLNRCILAIGRKGTGKSTIARRIAEVSRKKTLVLDTDDHPDYAAFELWDPANLHKWKTGNIRIITSEPEIALQEINRKASNAFVICEDAAKYINANIQKEVKSFIIDHRKRNFDLLMMFHFLADVPPYVAKQYDFMLLFKTGDSLAVSQNKFANWHTILNKLQRINAHPSFNYCEKINIDE